MNKGTVKWFSNQKGYGFITDAETGFWIHEIQLRLKPSGFSLLLCREECPFLFYALR